MTGEPSALPFHLIIDDSSGNSFVSNPNAPLADNNMKVVKYQ